MKNKYNKDNLQLIVNECKSIAEVLRKLNIRVAGGNYQTINSKIKLFNIDVSHFTGQGWNVELKFKPNYPKTLDMILKENTPYQSHKLKLRLIKEGLKRHICENCYNDEWLNELIPLELHHLNGINSDNRIENIQLLCPNCHALTHNYRGKNIKKR